MISYDELMPGDIGSYQVDGASGHCGIYVGTIGGVAMWCHCSTSHGINGVRTEEYNNFTTFSSFNELAKYDNHDTHDYEGTVTKPTCTEKGYTTYTCTRCYDSYEDNYTDALGHNYTETVTDPTCTEEGFTTLICSRCGDSYTADYVEAHGHTWDDGIVTEEATSEEDGSMEYTCLTCGETKVETLSYQSTEDENETLDASPDADAADSDNTEEESPSTDEDDGSPEDDSANVSMDDADSNDEEETEAEEQTEGFTSPDSSDYSLNDGSAYEDDSESTLKGTVQTGDDFNGFGLIASLAVIAALAGAGYGIGRRRKHAE